MHDQIGPTLLAIAGAFFAGFGLRELSLAYRVLGFRQWTGKAALATTSLLLAGVILLTAFRMMPPGAGNLL